MLTSLLSFYIAANFGSDISESGTNQFASLNLTNILKHNESPIKDPSLIAPVLATKAIIVIDLKTGETLYGENINERLSIASITKLMTILLILEENKLEDIATISENAATTQGSTMYLRAGEQITLENLIYGSIINSANDSAVALAEHNAGSTSAFVEKMNRRANELGLINTHFSNPIGLDQEGNYSSAYDLAKLGSFIYHNEFIKKAATIKNMSVKSIDEKYVHRLESTNELLDSYLKIKGLKTGSTDSAGLCLISIAENEQGNEILTVLLNSPARFKETKILTDWIFRAYKWY